MMALMIVLAFTAGVSAQAYRSTGSIALLLASVVLSVACVFLVVGYVVRERGLP